MECSSTVDAVTQKANRTLNFIKRNLQVRNTRLKTTAYNTLVRPLVEYAPSVWDPYTATDINKIEMVQRRAARYVLHRYHNTSSVSEMLQTLGWHTLLQRREQARLCMLFKIHTGSVAVNKDQYIIPMSHFTPGTHPYRYRIPYSRCDYHKFSFFPRTIRAWNGLPVDVVTAESYNSFKSRLSIMHTTRRAL